MNDTSLATTEAPADVLRAGVIGLGMIGGGVATALAARGRVPVVFDVRPDAADALAGVPAVLPTPADVACDSDVVFVAVVNADQARSVLAGPDGVLSVARPGLTVVLMATVSVASVLELAALCAASGVRLLDCGVTTTTIDPVRKIVAIIGGDDDAVEHARPVLDDAAAAIVHCGPLGSGMATKIARNMITYGSWRVVDEASRLLDAYGLSPARLVEVITLSDPAGRTQLAPLGLRFGGGSVPSEQVDYIMGLLHKDLAAARELAGELGVEIPVTELTDATAEEMFAFAEGSAR